MAHLNSTETITNSPCVKVSNSEEEGAIWDRFYMNQVEKHFQIRAFCPSAPAQRAAGTKPHYVRFISWAVFNLDWKKYEALKPWHINSLLTERSHKEQQVSNWHPSINFSTTLSCAQSLECISCTWFFWEGVTSTVPAYLQYLMSKHFSSKRLAHKNVNPSFSNAHKGAATLFTVSSPHPHPHLQLC